MDESLKKEDILLPIGFDLTPTASRKKTDGIAALFRDRISVYENGEKTSDIPTESIAEIVFQKRHRLCFRRIPRQKR